MDGDWSWNACDRRSTSGHTFSLGSAAIAWCSKQQPIVALSSTKAEYGGVVVATCEIIWLKRLLRDLQVEVTPVKTIYYDKLSSIQLAKNPIFHARTKHIEVHYHFFCERVLFGEVELVYVATDRKIADIFTKPISVIKLRHFRVCLAYNISTCQTWGGRSEEGDERDKVWKADTPCSNIN